MRALFPLFLLLAAARADLVVLPPPGEARLRNVLDLGPFADRVCSEIRVRKGDTLGALAQKHLGSAERHREILALNPGIEEKALKIGTKLLLPPRLDPKESGLPWIDFIDRIGPTHLRYFTGGDTVRGTLFAVPHEYLAKWMADPARPLEGVATGTPPGGTEKVDPDSRVSVIERRWRLREIRAGKLEWDLVGERRLDEAGRPVEASGAAPASRNGGPSDLLFGCLSAAGFLGLAYALSRRRRAQAA